MSKVVLTYSGGLETTVAIHWLKHQHNLKVIALGLNLGQGRDLDVVAERAIGAGAAAVHVLDVRRSFLKKYCWKVLKAGARYEGGYLLSAALSRPLIATEVVRLAHEEGATIVAHGSHPEGNDQFRFECSIAALDPSLTIMAPVREWKMKSRKQVIEYARRFRLPVDRVALDNYTRDMNIWGARASGGELADISRNTPESAFSMTASPEAAPNEAEEVEIGFVKGEPVTINGEKLDPIELLEKLNALGAKHGVGRMDTIENRLMGFKNHEVYEAPGAAILHNAHAALERLVLDKRTYDIKHGLSNAYAEVVYQGQWFSTLREALDAFVSATQEYVTGTVTMKLYKGAASAERGHSEFSTYNRDLLRMEETGGALPAGAAEGMLTIARLVQMNRAFKQKPRV